MHTPLRISLIQTDIIWENKSANLKKVESKLSALRNQTDLVVLPEMFSTGFSMNSHLLAEPITGETICRVKRWSNEYGFAISGSFICKEDENYYNRAFFITPEGDEFYYDKRHLFRMGNEIQHFNSGKQRCIFNYKGWNINLIICYDLRFPVWIRNYNNEYDILLVVANWPASRKQVWETLLYARAIENQCFVCGVNRVGIDGNGLMHSGQSIMINAKGEKLTIFEDGKEKEETICIDKELLELFRAKFPVWKDADPFKITKDI